MNKIKFLLFFTFIVGIISAQTFEEKKITLRENGLKYTADRNYIFNTGSDENAYYIAYYDVFQGLTTKNQPLILLIIGKDFKNHKKVELKVSKEETLYSIAFAKDNIFIIAYKYDKKKKETAILLKRYSKTTGEFIDNKILASISTPTKHNILLVAASPDKKKYAITYLAGKKGDIFDSFYEFVLDLENNAEVIRKDIHKLNVSNSVFGISGIAINNDAVLMLVFDSKPQNKRDEDSKFYIDGRVIGENINESFSFNFDGKLFDSRLKVLNNGNFFFAYVTSNPKGNYIIDPGFLKTFIFDVERNEVSENYLSVMPELDYRSRAVILNGNLIPSKPIFSLGINSLVELDNGEIAVVMTQQLMVIIQNQGVAMITHLRGEILTAFANKDGVIENYDTYNRFQKSDQSKYLGLFAFAKGNNLYYMFNENPDNFIDKDRTKTRIFKNYNDAVIVCNKLANGEKSEIIFVTEKTGKDNKCLQSIVLRDDDNKNKFIVLTMNKETIDFEILNLE